MFLTEGTTLYCGNLPWSVTDEELTDLFNLECGSENIASATVARFGSDRSKGWGLVTFNSEEAANNAIEKMDGHTVGDRQISLREDKGASERRSKPRTGEPVDDQTLFVGNLAFDCDDARLAALFEGLSVESSEIQLKRDGSSKGFALVRLATAEDAEKALETLDNVEEGGRTLSVRRDRRQKPRNETNGEAGEGEGKKKRTRNRRRRKTSAGEGEGEQAAPQNGTAAEGEEGPRRTRNRNRNRRKKAPAGPALTAFVKNLPLDVDTDGLLDLFTSFGAVNAVVKTTEDGTSKGFGVVTFSSEEAAANAIGSVNGTAVTGGDGQSYTLEVREDKQPPRPAAVEETA